MVIYDPFFSFHCHFPLIWEKWLQLCSLLPKDFDEITALGLTTSFSTFEYNKALNIGSIFFVPLWPFLLFYFNHFTELCLILIYSILLLNLVSSLSFWYFHNLFCRLDIEILDARVIFQILITDWKHSSSMHAAINLMHNKFDAQD